MKYENLIKNVISEKNDQKLITLDFNRTDVQHDTYEEGATTATWYWTLANSSGKNIGTVSTENFFGYLSLRIGNAILQRRDMEKLEDKFGKWPTPLTGDTSGKDPSKKETLQLERLLTRWFEAPEGQKFLASGRITL